MENWTNPAGISENLLLPGACIGDESLRLDRKWRFILQSPELPAPENWTVPDFSDKKWSRTAVPNTSDTSAPSGTGTQTGYYRKSFLLARDHGNRRVILHFDVAPAGMMLWVNGTCIGSSGGIEIPADFDISLALRPDRNVVCVQIPNDPCQGIPCNVSLHSLPGRRIARIHTDTLWTGDGTPVLQVDLKTRNADGFTARIALMDGERVIGYRESPIRDDSSTVSISCPDVSLWCAENPKLYRVAVILWDGVAIHHTAQITVGFRRISTENHALILNGRPEKLFAVGYDPVDSISGCARSAETIASEFSLIREHNLNAILLSRPMPEAFLDLCDQLGLYVLFTGGQKPSEQTSEEAAAAQNQRMALLFGAHPSVLAWNIPGEHPGVFNMDSVRIIPGAGSSLPDDTVPALLQFDTVPEKAHRRISEIRTSGHIIGALFRFTPRESNFTLFRELKHLLQPIGMEYEDETLTITNFSQFRSTDVYLGRYRLTRDEETVVQKEILLTVAPGSREQMKLETRYDIFRPGRYYLTVEYLHRNTETVAAFAQWPVGYLRHVFDENAGGTIRDDSGTIMLRSEHASYTVSRTFGTLDQISLETSHLLTAPATPVYRDAGVRSSGFRIPDEWDKLSSGRKRLKPSVLEVDHMTRTVVASFRLGSGLMQTGRLYADGSMSLEFRLRTGRTAPSLLGVRIPMRKEFDRFCWFGLGPDDAVSGHPAGRFFGIHEQCASTTPRGKKEPVFSLTVVNSSGQGLMIRSEDGLRASFSAESVCNTLQIELPVEEMMPHTTYVFSFTIQPIS